MRRRHHAEDARPSCRCTSSDRRSTWRRWRDAARRACRSSRTRRRRSAPATVRRRSAASGWLGCFSFYPTKNLGAFGDAGLVTTNDDAAGRRGAAPARPRHGSRSTSTRWSAATSASTRMQAAVLRVKLPHLDALARGPAAQRRALPRSSSRAAGLLEHRHAAGRAPGRLPHLQPVRGAKCRERDALRAAPDQPRHRHRDLLPGAVPPAGVLRSTSATRTAPSRRPKPPPAGCSRCRSIPSCPSRTSRASSRRSAASSNADDTVAPRDGVSAAPVMRHSKRARSTQSAASGRSPALDASAQAGGPTSDLDQGPLVRRHGDAAVEHRAVAEDPPADWPVPVRHGRPRTGPGAATSGGTVTCSASAAAAGCEHRHGPARRPAGVAGGGRRRVADAVVERELVSHRAVGRAERPPALDGQRRCAQPGHDPDRRPPCPRRRPRGRLAALVGTSGDDGAAKQHPDQYLDERMLHRRADQAHQAQADNRQRPAVVGPLSQPPGGKRRQQRAGKTRGARRPGRARPTDAATSSGRCRAAADAQRRQGEVEDHDVERRRADTRPRVLGDRARPRPRRSRGGSTGRRRVPSRRLPMPRRTVSISVACVPRAD